MDYPLDEGVRRRRRWIPWLLALLFIWILTGLIGRRSGYTVDAKAPFHLTQEILATGNLFPGVSVKQGYLYSIVFIPFYKLGDFLHMWLPAPEPDFFQRKCLCWMNTALTGVTVGLLSLTIRELGYSVRAQVWLPLLYGYTTLAFAYARYDYNKCLAGLLLLASLYFFIRNGRQGRVHCCFACGCCLGLLAALRLEMALVVLVYFYAILRRPTSPVKKWKQSIWLLFPFTCGVGFVVLYNIFHWEGSIAGGYEGSFQINPFPALIGFLFSPGKSLFLFNPILLLLPLSLGAFIKRHHDFSALLFGVLFLLFLLYSFWGNWWGGWGLGPRHLVPLLPLAVIPLAAGIDSNSRKFNGYLAITGGAGLCIQWAGSAIPFTDVIHTLMGRFEFIEQQLIWVPQCNALYYHVLFLFFNPVANWDYGLLGLTYWLPLVSAWIVFLLWLGGAAGIAVLLARSMRDVY